MTRHALPTPAPRPVQPRQSHRAVVEHHDIAVRDFDLDVTLGRDVSHRRCAGGPDCQRTTPTVLSLPGATLTLAAAVVAVAALALGGAR